MSTIQILIDTSFIIALVNERDQFHDRAIEVADQYDGQSLIVTDVVLLEVANALARGYKTEAIEVIEYLLHAEDVEIVPLTTNLWHCLFREWQSMKNLQE